MKERKRSVFGVRRILSAVFAVGFVVALLSTINAFAAANLFKIQDAKLSELSTGATGAISTFDETNIESNVTFHKLDDSAKYTITLKNTDSKDHVIQSITDDNDNPYVFYEYSSYANTVVKAGESFDFVVTAKYANAVTDKNARAQATNVKFFLQFTDIEEPEVIPITPNTGDNIMLNVVILAVSATGLIVCAAIAIKRNKKTAKYLAVVIVAVAAVAVTAGVKAATVEINSISITSNYGLYDKSVVTWTDANGDEHEEFVPYNEPANIQDPDKPGYTFIGWEDEDGNPVDPSEPITEDIKIHPTFRANKYTIKFNGNGATGSMDNIEMTYDEAKTLPTNAFIFAGRTYMGWDTETNGSGVHHDDRAEVKNLTTEDNGVVTLYAQWSVNPFFINYDGNGATSGEMVQTNCEYDGECVLRENAFKKTGYHFIGWKYNNNDYANKADVKNIIESGTITMVAQWAVNHYTIVFDINTEDPNAAGNMADMTNLEYDHDYTLTANAFTRTGYNFGGWNTEIDGRNFGLTDEQEFHNLTTTDNAIITLYAQWDPIHYNVVFHQNRDGVTGNTNSMTNIAYDDARTLTQNGFELAHYKFMGWNSAEDGTGTPYEDKASIKNLTATDGATVDFYAQWKERTATLNTGANVRTAIKSLADAPTTFKKYDGENLPDFDTLDGKVDIALADSNFPVWAWVDGDNIYWWSEAERPNFNSNSSTMFQSMTTLTTIDLDGLESSTAVNMSYLFNGCTGLTSLDISEFDTANVQNMMAMFYNTPALTSINTAVLNTANVNNMSFMFRDTGATSIDISNFNTANVKTMQSMFENTKASSIILGNPDTLKVTNMANMFQDTLNITSLDVSGLDTDNVESMGGMFEAFKGTPKLTSLNLSNFKTSKVKSFSAMFYGQANLTNLDVRNFNTSSATTMYMMFLGMTKAQSINVSGWTNDKGPAMDYMFSYTGMGVAGGTVINFENFNTENVTNMDHMFSDMRSETVLDLSSFDTAKVTKMSGMFAASYASTPMALKTVYVSDKFVTTALTGTQDNIFDHTRAIVGGAGTAWDASSIEKARIDDPDNSEPGYFTYKNARYIRYHDNDGDDTNDEANYALMPSHYMTADANNPNNLATKLAKYNYGRIGYAFLGWATSPDGEVVYADEAEIADLEESKTPLELYAKWEAKTSYLQTGSAVRNIILSSTTSAKTFTHYEGIPDLDSIAGKKVISTTASATPTYAWVDGETIYWWADAAKVYMAADSSSMFEDKTNLTTINLAGLDSSAVTNTSKMFKGCTGLADLDLSPLSDAQLASVTYMFDGASNLAAVDLSQLNTSQVTDFTGFLRNNSSRTSIDLSTIDTSSATNLTSMLEGCSGITSLDLSKLNSQNVTNMTALFKGMSGLTKLNLAPLYAEKVDTMTSLFENCTGIASLDVSVLDTKNVEKMDSMFSGMSELATLKVYDNDNDTTAFQTSKVTTMAKMFNNDQKLTNLDVTHFDVSKVEDMSSMFLRNYKANIDITNWDTSSLKNMSQIFFVYGNGNPNLPTGYKTMNTSSVTNMNDFFRTMPGQGYSDIDFSQWDFSKVTTPNFAGNNYGVYSGRTMHLGKFDLSSMAANGTINFGDVNVVYVTPDYDPSIAAEKNLKFNYPNAQSRDLRGQNGTSILEVLNDETKNQSEYLRIDDPAHGNPGFFWVENPLVVNFDAGEGVASYASYRYIPGTDYGTLPTVTTSPEGKIFAGWYTAAEGGEKIENSAAFISNETHTLYAHWEEAGFGGTIDLERQYSSIDVLQASNTMPQGYVGAAYFNPADLSQTCTATSENIADKTAKSGCMKWYIYGEDGDNYKMILDHNTTTRISFNNISSALASDTADWDNESLTVGILSAEDVAAIANLSSFDINVTDSYLYLNEHETHTQGNSPYVWLYDYTENCVALGCDNETSGGFGFWTTSGVHGKNDEAWLINYMGRLTTAQKSLNNWGIRPIITVSKEAVNAE